MIAVVAGVLFVIAGLYTRREYGAGPLILLWAVATLLMAVTSSAGFVLLLNRFGSSTSAPGRALAFTFMLLVDGMAFGGAAIAVHKMHRDDGPWLTGEGILWGIVGFAAGGAVAVGLAAVTLVGFVGQMAK
ncbi:MAG TPA: hypothetical protein VEU08_19445 [Vicinamibacterales bacterium]|nr:hypothetical protein [Vicinamibacterales bacterium]